MPDEHIVVGCVQMNVYNTCSSGRVESVSVSECFDLETAIKQSDLPELPATRRLNLYDFAIYLSTNFPQKFNRCNYSTIVV